MIFSSLLLTAVGVRISVFGEGRLCFEANGDLMYASASTLAPNRAGLLADAAGHPVLPHIPVSNANFAVAMNGNVTVAGRHAGWLVLRKADGSLGRPGEGSFGLIQIGGVAARTEAADLVSGTRSAIRDSRSSAQDDAPLVVIAIHPRSVVDNDRVRLGDIADLSGDPRDVRRLGRIDLGDAPLIGNRRSFSRWTLQAALHDAGFTDADYKIESFPPDVAISRKAQIVEVNTLADVALAEARRVVGGTEPTPLPGPVVTSVTAPVGELKVVAKAIRNGDKLAVRTTVVVDGHEVADRNFLFQAKLDGIKPGDAIRVAVAYGAAAVETDAKAKTGGTVGDTIQILTGDGTTLTATVTGVGKAEVKL